MAYNGWSNYETWNVKLWLDNDEGAHQMVREEAGGTLAANTDDDGIVDENGFGSVLGDWLKSYHQDQAAEVLGDGASVFHDLLNSALQEVNWTEIAAAYLDDAKEDAGI